MTPEKTPAQIRLEDPKELRYVEAVEWLDSLSIHDPGAPKAIVAEIFARALRTEEEVLQQGRRPFPWRRMRVSQDWVRSLNIDPVTLQVVQPEDTK